MTHADPFRPGPADREWLASADPGCEPVMLHPDWENNNYVSGDRSGDRLLINYYRFVDDGSLRAKVFVGPRAEGPPGHAHGGSMAALLDEVMGASVWMAGHKVVAVQISFSLRDMLPLGARCLARGGVVDVDGRKVRAKGVLCDESGRVHCEGEGLFLQLRPEHLAAMSTNRRGSYRPTTEGGSVPVLGV